MNGAESIFTAAGETHQRIRKTFTNAFSDRALKKQSPIIESYANLLMTRLRREVSKSPEGKVNISKFYEYAALDIITGLTSGQSFYGLDNEHSWVPVDNCGLAILHISSDALTGDLEAAHKRDSGELQVRGRHHRGFSHEFTLCCGRYQRNPTQPPSHAHQSS